MGNRMSQMQPIKVCRIEQNVKSNFLVFFSKDEIMAESQVLRHKRETGSDESPDTQELAEQAYSTNKLYVQRML